MPKSEAFTLELSARMAVRARAFCIESGDDLGPFLHWPRSCELGGWRWKSDGTVFFSLRSSWLVQGREEENFQPSIRPAVHFDTPLYHTKTKLEYKGIRRQRAVNL